METKQYISVEVKKGDFTFVFQMPNGASWGNALDASFDLLQHIIKMSQQASEQLRPVQQSPEGE